MTMVRSFLAKVCVLLILLILLCPAAVYLTSPWWAASACRWAATRWWQIDLRLATAVLNPFTLRVDGAGGSFKGPPGQDIKVSGELARCSLEVDLGPLLRERRVHRLSLEFSSLTVAVREGMKMLPLSRRSLEVPGARLLPVSVVSPTPARRGWYIERLSLRIDRGVLQYSENGRRGEISMDMNLSAIYNDISDPKELAQKILQDLLTKASYGFMAERLFR